MQTDSFTILVGPDECAYKIPEGRLTFHSSVFSYMCSASFAKSNERVIKLPEEDPRVFDDFYDWMYSSKPCVDIAMGAQAMFDLAIFAEKYHICHLKNRITDFLNEEWSEENLDAKIVDHVYSSVPNGAILRKLCASILKRRLDNAPCGYYDGALMAGSIFREYESVFALHADLGRDFFRTTAIHKFGPCTFHDHSNIAPPLEFNTTFCPYLDNDFILDKAI